MLERLNTRPIAWRENQTYAKILQNNITEAGQNWNCVCAWVQIPRIPHTLFIYFKYLHYSFLLLCCMFFYVLTLLHN